MAYKYRSRNPETGEMELYEDAGRSIPVDFGGFNFLGGGIPSVNLPPVNQEPRLGPDQFGSYSIPTSDPTYSTGQQYARSIAGGMPMSQVIAPGVSYSPEQPMGYTQEQLNTPVGTTPVEPPPPPPAQEPDDPRYFGTGIGGVNIPVDRKDIPFRNIFGNIPSIPAQEPGFDFSNIDIDALRQQIADSGIDFTNLFGLPQVPNGSDFSIENLNLPDFSNFVTQQDLPVYDQPDLSQFITQQDLPAFNPKDYRDDFLSIAREGIEMPSYEQPDLSEFAKLTDIPTFDPSGLQQQIGGLEQQIAGMPQFNPQDYRDDFLSIAREGIEMPSYQAPDLSGFMTQEDINKAISGINIPQYQAPDLSGYDTRLADLEKTLLSLQQPVANDRFSVNQLNPIGLF